MEAVVDSVERDGTHGFAVAAKDLGTEERTCSPQQQNPNDCITGSISNSNPPQIAAHRQTDSHQDHRQTDRETERQTDRQTISQTNRQPNRQTVMTASLARSPTQMPQTATQTDRQSARQTDRQTLTTASLALSLPRTPWTTIKTDS